MTQTVGKSQHRFVLTMLTLGHLTNDWVAGTIWLIAPAIATSMGMGPAEVGLILTVHGIGAGLAYIPAGIAADRYTRQGVMMLVTFWWVAFGYFCATLAPGFWPVTLFLVVGVLGDAFWHPVATGYLVKTMPAKRAQVLGIHAMGGSIGAEVLGPLTAGFLLGIFDWRVSLQILTIPAIIMGAVFLFVAGRFTLVSQQRISTREFKQLLSHWVSRRGAGIGLSIIFYNMALMAMLAMTPLYLQTAHNLSPFVSGAIFAAILLFGTFMQPFVGKFSDQVGRKQVLLVIMSAGAIFAVGASLLSGLTSFLLTLAASIALLTAARPVFLAAAVDFTSQSEATTLGLVFTLMDSVGALGALFAGYVGEISLHYAYLLAAILALTSLVVTFLTQYGYRK